MVHASSEVSFERNDAKLLRSEQLPTGIQTMGTAWGCAIARSTRYICTPALACNRENEWSLLSCNLVGKKQTVSLPSLSMSSVHDQLVTITIIASLILQVKLDCLLFQYLPKEFHFWGCNFPHTREEIGERLVFESLEDGLLVKQQVHHALLGDLRNAFIS